MISSYHGHTGELALCASHGRQRNRTHSGDGFQHFLQLKHALQKTLTALDGTQRMTFAEFRQHSEPIADPRIVFHRAGSERVKIRVNRKISL
jgi:hypothetical protein